MKQLFRRNIGTTGRLARGICAAVFFVGAWLMVGRSAWLALGLTVCGTFALFEALRGWCALRACGIKTKL